MSNIEGPTIYKNWISSKRRKKILRHYEVPVFSDGSITGEISEDLGPYKVFNTVSLPVNLDEYKPVIVLRIKIHHDYDTLLRLQNRRTDDDLYHGGYLVDEIASLLSLSMGMRLKAGGSRRSFSKTDPKGTPYFNYLYMDPKLMIDYGMIKSPRIPRARNGYLHDAAILKTIPKMDPQKAVILIKVARMYQDALWLSEAEPELTWLLFTSALETAANYWKSEQGSPVERMYASKPELKELLDKHGDPSLTADIADLISDYMGATKKYIDFVLNYLPSPPKERPSKQSQLPWNKREMKKRMRKVYAYRSKKLHAGKSIPSPMCNPPDRDPGSENFSEVFLAPFMATGGGVWKNTDLPMNLHTYEYITRNVLLNWWQAQS